MAHLFVSNLVAAYEDYATQKQDIYILEPVHEKTNNLGFRPGPTQTSLYSHRRNPES